MEGRKEGKKRERGTNCQSSTVRLHPPLERGGHLRKILRREPRLASQLLSPLRRLSHSPSQPHLARQPRLKQEGRKRGVKRGEGGKGGEGTNLRSINNPRSSNGIVCVLPQPSVHLPQRPPARFQMSLERVDLLIREGGRGGKGGQFLSLFLSSCGRRRGEQKVERRTPLKRSNSLAV